MKRAFLLLSVVVSLMWACLVAAEARSPDLVAEIALGGYDPVGYFVHNKPTKGRTEFALRLNGRIYHFASLEHMRIFASDPQRYAPQYGGFCVLSVVTGERVRADPTQFSIVNGQLFLHKDAAAKARWAAQKAN